MIFKKYSATLFALCALSFNVEAKNEQDWYNLKDPRAVYSSVTVGAGTEGVNISASYGGYLNGQYKHKVTVEAMNDLEYYNFDYMVVNASTDSGFSIETTWERDLWGFTDLNDTALGVFTKIPLLNNKLNIYPKLNLGHLWNDNIESTTYIKFDATTRYTINQMFWVGITPTYAHAMKGYDFDEWDATLDVGAQLSATFAVASHGNTDDEYWVDATFAF